MQQMHGAFLLNAMEAFFVIVLAGLPYKI